MKNIDKIVENFLDTGKLINEYGRREDKIQRMIGYLESDNLTNYEKAINIWDNLSLYEQGELEIEMIGNMTLLDFIEKEIPKIKEVKETITYIFEKIEKSKKLTPLDKLNKVKDVLDSITEYGYEKIFEDIIPMLSDMRRHYETITTSTEKFKDEKETEERIKEKNITIKEEPISILSKDNQGDKELLNILHNIFLYGIEGYYSKELEKEKEDSNFGNTTEKTVKKIH